MDPATITLIAVMMGLAAVLYSSVGHGGASAYLAVMALFALPPEVMRPTALVLNILVAGVASIRFVRAGQVDFRLLAPFAATAVPAAFLGGTIDLPAEVYRPIVGLFLLAAAGRLFIRPATGTEARAPAVWVRLLLGAAIGFASGLVGVGGGIFLSPIILLLAWETPRKTSGVAAVFILLNSLAGLAGNLSSVGGLPSVLPVLAGAVLVGGLIGTSLGGGRLGERRIFQTLSVVLVIAGGKLVLT